MNDPFDLQRFVDAQETVYPAVLSELRAGRKQSHWMRFIFPQIAGLGHSQRAVYYALSGVDEARAYLAHPVLGPRLRRCCEVLCERKGLSAEEIFGDVDAMKLRSSLTLFAEVSGDSIFEDLLKYYFAGQPDPSTHALLTKT